jgi:hypothetical protein
VQTVRSQCDRTVCCRCCLDVLQMLNELQAAQQSWAGQGLLVAPTAVFVLPGALTSQTSSISVPASDAGTDMEEVCEVRAEEGTVRRGVLGGGDMTCCLCVMSTAC